MPGNYGPLRVESDYPHQANWRISNTSAEPITVSLYIPKWVEGIEADGFYTATIEPKSTLALDGTLVETERELLAPTTAFNPETPKGIIKMKGPLVLAKYGEEWSPIFEDYLRGDMSIGNSAKELITTTCSGRVVA